MDDEGEGRPAGGGLALFGAAVHDGVVVAGGVGRYARDLYVVAAARETQGHARAVNVGEIDIHREDIVLVLLDDDIARGADALGGHELLREHIDIVAHHAVAGDDAVRYARELLGGVVALDAVAVFDVVARADEVGVVLLERGERHDAVKAVGGRSGVASHHAPARRGGGGSDARRTELEAAVGELEGSGRDSADIRGIVGIVLFILVLVLLALGRVGVLLGCGHAALVVGQLLESDIVEEGVAGGQSVAVVRGIFAEREVDGQRARRAHAALDIDLVGHPLAFGVDAGELGVGGGRDIDARAGIGVLIVGVARDAVGQDIHGEFVVSVLLDGEGGGGVAVRGGTVVLVARLVLLGHVDHERVLDRVVFAIAAVRGQQLVKSAVLVVPEMTVLLVGRGREIDRARDDILMHGGGAVQPCARPARHRTREIARSADDFEVGVGDEQSLGGFRIRRGVRGGIVGIAGGEHQRGDRHHH